MSSRPALAFSLALTLQAILPPALPAAFSYTITDLGTLGGSNSSAGGVNDAGQVVGTSTTVYGASRAFGYSAGVMYDLGTLGGDYSTATAINDNNVIAGTSGSTNPPNPDSGNDYGFVFLSGRMQNLATLGGPGDLYVFPNCMNNSGQIAGTYTPSYGEIGFASFVYSGGTTAYLGSGISESLLARGINDGGKMVGSYQSLSGGPQYGFLYSGGVRYDLNILVDLSGSDFTHLADAVAISNTGYIVGTGTTTGGNTHAFLLTPIPVP